MNQELKIKVTNELKCVSNLTLRYIRNNVLNQDKAKITRSQGLILGFIYSRQQDFIKVYQKDIEKAFSVRRSTATETMKRLESQGLITRKTSIEDARLKEIVLTEKAKKGIKQVEDHVELMSNITCEGITEEELSNFYSMLIKMKNNLLKQENQNEKNSKKLND